MSIVQRRGGEKCGRLVAGRGLLNGLLIAIPLWVVLGILATMVFRHGSMDTMVSAALMIAMVSEAILLRPYACALLAKIRRPAPFRPLDARENISGKKILPRQRAPEPSVELRGDLERFFARRYQPSDDLRRYVQSNAPPSRATRHAVAAPSLLRQSLALGALAGAYLHFYFMEVNLQIASLNSVVTFLPVKPLG